MRVLGISAYYHDSAAAFVDGGRIVAAAQEERFTRVKHDARFPRRAVEFCLAEGGVGLADLDAVVFYDKPFLKFERLLETYLATAPRGFASFRRAVPVWIKEKLFLKRLLKEELARIAGKPRWSGQLLFSEHHVSHAASAFYASPFDDALVLTMDGVGEWATTSAALGQGTRLDIFKEIHFPHSLGLLYSAFTYYLGFKVNSGEYKVMGLAPYGQPRFKETILRRLIDVKSDGSFRLEMGYFDYCAGLAMTNRRFDALFGAPPRRPQDELTRFHMDVAASIQTALEEIVLKLVRSLAAETGARNLCLAGGVALNCTANGKIRRERIFDRIWIQPAAGDAGGALGAALAVCHQIGNAGRMTDGIHDAMRGSHLGPHYTQADMERRLAAAGARFEVQAGDGLFTRTVERLAAGDAVGWFQGRMEFGPRALGARSILADPRNPQMQRSLNLRIKYRESFRPFAPAVLREDAQDYFDLDGDSPYMLMVADVLERHRLPAAPGRGPSPDIDGLTTARSTLPAVTHVDHSARLQTVAADANPRFHRLLSAFKAATGCPVLVNTSFNVRGEPIVCTPEDAFRCFMGCEMETLVIGDCILRKAAQDPALKRDYKGAFEPD